MMFDNAHTKPDTFVASLGNTHLSYPSAEGEVKVLRGIDLQIENGETLAVTGPSGSGKSSLIAVFAGLELATAGNVNVLGVDFMQANEADRTALRRQNIGVVFQSFHLVPAMTAVQNAALPLMLAGDPDSEAKSIEMLQRVGLGHRLSHRPAALSGGEQQRVAIARAFAASPRLVLADEPTGNLDQTTGDEVTEVMFDLIEETRAAMVLVTHDKSLAEKCDRMIEIDAGRISS